MKRLRKTLINYDATVLEAARCGKWNFSPQNSKIDKTVLETKLLLKLAEDKFNQIGFSWSKAAGDNGRQIVCPVRQDSISNGIYEGLTDYEYVVPKETSSQDDFNQATVRRMQKRINELEKLVNGNKSYTPSFTDDYDIYQERGSVNSGTLWLRAQQPEAKNACVKTRKHEKAKKKRPSNTDKHQTKQKRPEKRNASTGDIRRDSSHHASKEKPRHMAQSENSLPCPHSHCAKHDHFERVATNSGSYFEIRRQARMTESIVEQLDKQRDDIHELKYLVRECILLLKHEKHEPEELISYRTRHMLNRPDDKKLKHARGKDNEIRSVDSDITVSKTETEPIVPKRQRLKSKEKVTQVRSQRKCSFLRCLIRWCTCSHCCRN